MARVAQIRLAGCGPPSLLKYSRVNPASLADSHKSAWEIGCCEWCNGSKYGKAVNSLQDGVFLPQTPDISCTLRILRRRVDFSRRGFPDGFQRFSRQAQIRSRYCAEQSWPDDGSGQGEGWAARRSGQGEGFTTCRSSERQAQRRQVQDGRCSFE